MISDAAQVFDQLGANPEVTMSMNSIGTKEWAKMTSENVGKFVAVVLDDFVYSAPRVNDAITGGRTSITGQFSIEEAQDLANALKSGKLPAAARIIQSDVVGPSLGKEAIQSGYNLFHHRLDFGIVVDDLLLRKGRNFLRHRFGPQHSFYFRNTCLLRCSVDIARYCRYRIDHWYGRRCERADLRKN